MKMKIHRVIAGKTQYDLSRETGIAQSVISLIERGMLEASQKQRLKIAAVLGVSESEVSWDEC